MRDRGAAGTRRDAPITYLPSRFPIAHLPLPSAHHLSPITPHQAALFSELPQSLKYVANVRYVMLACGVRPPRPQKVFW